MSRVGGLHRVPGAPLLGWHIPPAVRPFRVVGLAVTKAVLLHCACGHFPGMWITQDAPRMLAGVMQSCNTLSSCLVYTLLLIPAASLFGEPSVLLACLLCNLPEGQGDSPLLHRCACCACRGMHNFLCCLCEAGCRIVIPAISSWELRAAYHDYCDSLRRTGRGNAHVRQRAPKNYRLK